MESSALFSVIPGTRFVVDGFTVGSHGQRRGSGGATSQSPEDPSSIYILSHFHADHYRGINETWSCPIYCTSITGSLLTHVLGVAEEYIHTLSMETRHPLDGHFVTFIDANHCPGLHLLSL